MKQKELFSAVAVLGLMGVFSVCTDAAAQEAPGRKNTAQPGSAMAAYAGSKSCRECHERFYGLWSGSIHGLAMQPYTETLAKEKLSPQKDDVVIGKQRYRAEIGAGGYVLETGADGARRNSTGSNTPWAARTSSTS